MSTSTHWGNWVRNRALYLGFRSQKTFAKYAGCSQNQVCRLFHSETPPRSMRTGHDEALCTALRTDPYTLFSNYVNIDSNAAPFLKRGFSTRSRHDRMWFEAGCAAASTGARKIKQKGICNEQKGIGTGGDL